jgi:ferredoxin-NADP reductase
MNKNTVKILERFPVTHDVNSFIVKRPKNFHFEPGQATDVAIRKKGLEKEKRPFTFTSLQEDPFLQFIIKSYPEHEGVTEAMRSLDKDDQLILHDVFGTITYRGVGTFIAGGAGITPFIAIFRDLQKKKQLFGNRLIFANKTKKDIILEKELREMFGDQFINILSEEKVEGYDHGIITEKYLIEQEVDTQEYIYLCGPPPMMEGVEKMLPELGVPEKSIIKEGL